MTELKFWKIVKQADWARDFDYERIRNWMLKTMTMEEIEKFRRIAGQKWQQLDKHCGSRNPAGGGDDSHSDLLYHVIALGKDVFEANLADYMLLAKRGDETYGSPDGYKESFGYAIPHRDDYDKFHDPNHFVSWAVSATDEISEILQMDKRDDLKPIAKEFEFILMALRDIVDGNPDEFVKKANKINANLERISKFFKENLMELPRKFTDNGFSGYNEWFVKNLLIDMVAREK